MKDVIPAILAIVVFLLIMYGCVVKAQEVLPPSRHIVVSGGVSGEWLYIGTIDKNSKEGFNPSMTYVVCDFVPIVHKMPDGRYQITFTSEIAKDLP